MKFVIRAIIALVITSFAFTVNAPAANAFIGFDVVCKPGLVDNTKKKLVSTPEVQTAVDTFQKVTHSTAVYIIVIDNLPINYYDEDYLMQMGDCAKHGTPLVDWPQFSCLPEGNWWCTRVISPNTLYMLFDKYGNVEFRYSYDSLADITTVSEAVTFLDEGIEKRDLAGGLIRYLQALQEPLKEAVDASSRPSR